MSKKKKNRKVLDHPKWCIICHVENSMGKAMADYWEKHFAEMKIETDKP